MTTHTGTYLAAQRKARHLNFAQVARQIGYRNIEKGSRRIQRLEREGRSIDGLLAKVIVALELDPNHVWSLVERDRREFEQAWRTWVSKPVEPELRVRLIAAIWKRERLAAGLSRAGATAYARKKALATGLTHVLVWNRAEEIWCYRDGHTTVVTMKVGEVAGPFTRLRGRAGRSGFLLG